MQPIRYTASGALEWDIRYDDDVIPPSGLREDVTVQSLNSPGSLTVVEDAVDATENRSVPVEDVKLLTPVPRPGKIACVGLNCYDHAEEQDEEIPERLLPLGETGTSVTNPGDPIIHPTAIDEVDYEVKLGVVTGQTAKDVDAGDVLDYAAGYTAINDVSGRDAQFDDGQFFYGKSHDVFTPMGLTFAPEGGVDPHDLNVTCRVDGETRQESNTSEFTSGAGEVVECISGITTPHPSDVVSTSTSGGVGIFRDPPELFEPGDSVDVETKGISMLTNLVIFERDEQPPAVQYNYL